MKIINGKAYKEVKLKELDKEELLEIIEDLQDRVEVLENSKLCGNGTNASPWTYNPLEAQLNGCNSCLTTTNC